MLAIITLFDQFSQVISESISHASRSGVIRLFITRTHLTRYKQKRPYVAFLILSKGEFGSVFVKLYCASIKILSRAGSVLLIFVIL